MYAAIPGDFSTSSAKWIVSFAVFILGLWLTFIQNASRKNSD